jgi:uncharacterized protein YutE (UPF0331/DUF86 family)
MTPRRIDPDVVTARLRLITDTLDQLGSLGTVTGERLDTEPLTRAAVERLLQVVVDLAVDINAHICAAELGRAPQSGRESFELAARAGIIPDDLAQRLMLASGLRNVLVHRYADIRTGLVAEAVGRIQRDGRAYLAAVAAFVTARGSSAGER